MHKQSENKQRIIDCFIFYNELDMLEYRLDILYQSVDAFILVESTRTFKGTLKPLYYEENKERFAKYKDKIVHIVVNDLLADTSADSEDVWNNEKHQRNCITFGINALTEGFLGWKLQGKDILVIADVDEILDPTKFREISSHLETNPQFNGILPIQTHMYYYCLRHKLDEIWTKVKAMYYSAFAVLPFVEYKRPGMKDVRNISDKIRTSNELNYWLEGNYGWHLSYFGNAATIANKLREFSHQEFNRDEYTNLDYIRAKKERGEDLFGRGGFRIITVEFKDNPYLPPFPPGSLDCDQAFARFPFTVPGA